MPRTAKLSCNGLSQAARLPSELQFDEPEHLSGKTRSREISSSRTGRIHHEKASLRCAAKWPCRLISCQTAEMAHHLFDTNIASYSTKSEIPSVDRRLAKVPPAVVFISAVTAAELWYRLTRRPEASRLRALVKEFLLTVTILPWDSEAAKQCGSLRARLERGGLPTANLDIMNGALSTGAVFVMNNSAFTQSRSRRWRIGRKRNRLGRHRDLACPAWPQRPRRCVLLGQA